MSQTTADATPPPKRRFLRNSRLVGKTAEVFHNFGLDAMAYRFGGALLVLLLIWNPTRFCYYNWVLPQGLEPMRDWATENPLKIVLAIPLVYAVYYGVRATQRSLGREALFLVAGGIAIVFVIFFWKTGIAVTGTIVILALWVGLALLTMVGLLSANWNRRLSGQIMTNQAGPVHTQSIDGHHNG